MFNFTTNTIINKATDDNGVSMFSAIANKQFTVKRTGVFDVENIKEINGSKIHKTPYQAEKNIEIEVGTTVAANMLCRLYLDIKLRGARQSDYATAINMGRKVYFEFKSLPVATDTLTELQTVINNQNARFEGAPVVTANNAVAAGVLSIDGTLNYQYVLDAYVETYDEATGLWSKNDTDFTVTHVQGNPGFGTYHRLIKDLRLPTIENMRYKAVYGNEMPLVTGEYTQYLLYYTKDRGVLGGDAVGQNVTSTTIHSFYVEKNVTTAFEAMLTTAGIVV